MSSVVISGSGLFTLPDVISNEELVASFNTYVDNYNARHAAAISAGDIQPKAYSSCEFIEKASGIKSRYVMSKAGILDPEMMRPQLQPVADDEVSLTVRMALEAASEALANAQKNRRISI